MTHAAIDIHTHILPPGWDDWAQRFGVTGWPACRLHDACNATIYLGEKEFRRVDERYLLGDIAKWKKVITDAGIKRD